MNTTFDVAIIGGGIIGSSIAYYVAKEGLRVAVFEQQQIAAKSTSAAAGMLGAHSESLEMDVFYPFARESQLMYTHLQQELKELCGIDIERKSGGILQLVFSQQEKEACHTLLSLPTVQWLNKQDAREVEPRIAEHILGAAYIEDDVNVLPVSVCQAFCKGAQLYGATVFEYTPVWDIKKQQGIFELVTPKGIFTANHVVIASGVWSTTFFHQLQLPLAVTPVKGECLLVSSEKSLLTHTLYHEQSYIVPRQNGQLVIGATMIPEDWSEHVTVGGIEALLAKAKTMLPTIGHLRVESSWAGLRPDTFDRKPFIGRHPEDEKLLFATGHYRNGILLAPATAQMICDFIVQRPVAAERVAAFQLRRGIGVTTI